MDEAVIALVGHSLAEKKAIAARLRLHSPLQLEIHSAPTLSAAPVASDAYIILLDLSQPAQIEDLQSSISASMLNKTLLVFYVPQQGSQVVEMDSILDLIDFDIPYTFVDFAAESSVRALVQRIESLVQVSTGACLGYSVALARSAIQQRTRATVATEHASMDTSAP
ncbi:hypothetical protein PTSG_02775 [Salpingoeca rosetta]|uniref:Centromere protein M n=1 Tax=Salpingoeca rosetta (strain ATCC 50818 / BSB-021) TaxID=946362 RepID=F2U3A1_SALR5|nr:uncharacterized protein PTSG_02775 [Salpingoeca rosetta]EGD82095.1 hypothetical protein PTSG_02775 [Salpingoeca rosetta]|eukprot:XP_004996278.1 hypothetical protein PTSG_02775 [Salpingoeca rosetta]